MWGRWWRSDAWENIPRFRKTVTVPVNHRPQNWLIWQPLLLTHTFFLSHSLTRTRTHRGHWPTGWRSTNLLQTSASHLNTLSPMSGIKRSGAGPVLLFSQMSIRHSLLIFSLPSIFFCTHPLHSPLCCSPSHQGWKCCYLGKKRFDLNQANKRALSSCKHTHTRRQLTLLVNATQHEKPNPHLDP